MSQYFRPFFCLKWHRFRGDIRILSDSTQANTARSQTLRRHCAELNNLNLQGILNPFIFRNIVDNFLKIQIWLTLRGVLLATILSMQASPCLYKPKPTFLG